MKAIYTLISLFLLSTFSRAQVYFEKIIDTGKHEAGNSIIQCSNGAYVILGYSDSLDDKMRMCLVKTDVSGNELWRRYYKNDSDLFQQGHCLKQASDGGFILCGFSIAPGSTLLIKTDSLGNETWRGRYNITSSGSSGEYVQVLAGGSFVVAGFCVVGNSTDACVLKVDKDGKEIWRKIYPRSDDDMAVVIRQTADGGFVFFGNANRNNNSIRLSSTLGS